MNKIWRCPECETVNQDEKCLICGYKYNSEADNDKGVNYQQSKNVISEQIDLKNYGEHKQDNVVSKPRKFGKVIAAITVCAALFAMGFFANDILNNNKMSETEITTTTEETTTEETTTTTEETTTTTEETTTKEITIAEPVKEFIIIKGEQYSTSLTSLGLSEKDLTDDDIKDLKYMTNLTELYLWDNQISDISALKNLTNLTYLSLWENQISDISALKNLTNLTILDLDCNQISDISALSNLTNLTKLYLDYNQISQEEVDKLQEALPYCDIVYY